MARMTATQRLYVKKKKAGLISKRFWLTVDDILFIERLSIEEDCNIEDTAHLLIEILKKTDFMQLEDTVN